MIKDISGHRYGRLLAIKHIGKNGSGKTLWECHCDCGNIKNITTSDLSSGRVNSCGCLRKEITAKKNFKDLTGKVFGQWTVVERGKTNNCRKIEWICECSCGNIGEVSGNSLLAGKSTMCKECLRKIQSKKAKTHGKSRSRIYKIFCGMKSRCFNPNNYSYSHYGARGIVVCNEWMGDNGFDNFYEWSMKNGYSDELSIDRIDVNGNYEPANCRWATNKEQANNTRKNKKYEYNNQCHTLKEWSEIVGIDYFTLVSRINKCNWNFERAIKEPVK